ARVPGNPDQLEMLGHSGGVICKRSDENMFIAGIQNRMIKADEEQLGRIEFTPLTHFDEIINDYNLSPLHPHYLSSFSFLRDKSFDLKASFGQDDINYTKNFLKHKANEVVESDITPLFIRDFFKARLLISSSQKEDIDTELIWIIWLEFLTILNLAKGKIHSVDELEEIFNNYRLLYSKTERDWAEELDNIIHSDYKGLKKDGLVIIGTKKSPDNDVFVIDKSIPLIANAKKNIDRDKLKIDDGMGYPLDEFTFLHFDYFKKGCISLRHEEYAELLDDQKLLEKLTSLYNDLFE
ncbi:MAG: ABC-three component system protein, partial [Candidatus Paceibacterota bacterium]